MSSTLLFTVKDAFQIAARGCALVPGPSTEVGAPAFRVGDAIRLVKPDGEAIDTRIVGVESIHPRPLPKVVTAAIYLPTELTTEHVPVGTQVLLMRDH